MLKTLLKNRLRVRAETKTILELAAKEDRALSPEEEQKVNDLKSQLDTLDRQIELAQSINLGDGDEDEAAPAEEEEEEKAAQSKTKLGAAGNLIKTSRVGAGDAKKEFDSFEEFFEAAIVAGQGGKVDSRLKYQEYSSANQEMQTGASGGFAVPAQFGGFLKEKSASAAIVRPRATVVPAGDPPDSEITFPALDQEPTLAGANRVFGGVQIAKVAEGGLKPTTNYKLRAVTLKPHEFAAIIPFTDKLLRNWKAATNWGSTLLRKAMTAYEDTQFISGNGVGGPEGILLASSTLVVNRQTTLVITLLDIQNMEAKFRGENGVYYVSNAAFAQLLTLVGNGGGATNIIDIDKSTGQVTLYGRPLVRSDRFAAKGALGDFALIDFSEYLIKDGSGPIIEAGFATGQWETNTRSIKITWNVDGRSALTRAYRGEDNFEVSSAVVLGLP